MRISHLFLLGVFTLSLLGCSKLVPLANLEPGLWDAYKKAFVHEDGRVIDAGNAGISHTEGQGYGMLLAVAANDRVTFEHMWNWTREHLRRKGDPLFSYRWDERKTPAVADVNNASDGDLLIAWALARAYRRWHVEAFKQDAITLAQAIRARLLRMNDALGELMLPGMEGFEHPGYVLVNPSYWIFPAFSELNALDPSSQWDALEKSGLELLERARFGNAGLPPDWVHVTSRGVIELGADDASRFGFEAVRVPLYTCWAGVEDRALLESIATQWSDPKQPAWVNLKTGQTAPYSLSPTQNVMNSILLRCLGRTKSGQTATTSFIIPNDYYASTLALLGELALKEHKP